MARPTAGSKIANSLEGDEEQIMRRCSILRLSAVVFLICAVLSTPALAGSETVALPDGTYLELAHPGVDGVNQPQVIAGSVTAPLYPAQVSRVGGDSSVTLAVLVRKNGSVELAEVMHADHPSLGFDEAAIRAVERWQFKPAMKNGWKPVHSFALVRLNFTQARPAHAAGQGPIIWVSSGGGQLPTFNFAGGSGQTGGNSASGWSVRPTTVQGPQPVYPGSPLSYRVRPTNNPVSPVPPVSRVRKTGGGN